MVLAAGLTVMSKNLAPVLRHHASAAFEPSAAGAAAPVEGGPLDVGADLAFGVVEPADLFGGEHGGEFVHIVALDLRRGGDVREFGLQAVFLRGFVGAGSAGTGVDGFVERFAVGLVDRFEFPALAGAQPQLADDLFAGRLVQLFERLVGHIDAFRRIDGLPGFGHGARDFAVGEVRRTARFGHGAFDLPAGRLHGPPGFCHGAFQLAGGDAPRGVRRCAGLGQQLFRFVAGRCGISRQGEQQGAEEKQDMFHS